MNQEQLKTVKKKIDKLASMDLRENLFEAYSLIGWLQGYVNSWYNSREIKCWGCSMGFEHDCRDDDSGKEEVENG